MIALASLPDFLWSVAVIVGCAAGALIPTLFDSSRGRSSRRRVDGRARFPGRARPSVDLRAPMAPGARRSAR